MHIETSNHSNGGGIAGANGDCIAGANGGGIAGGNVSFAPFNARVGVSRSPKRKLSVKFDYPCTKHFCLFVLLFWFL